MSLAQRARLARLLESAHELRNPQHERGRAAHECLVASSGLSAEGVRFAFDRTLEVAPSEADISALFSAVPAAARAHVLLSANVFVAAHRAIAIGLAASDAVFVRPSRREPHLAKLLLDGAPGLFQLVDELAPSAGDHVWAYGSDDTLQAVAARLPAGITLHGHGTGFGIAIVYANTPDAVLERQLVGLAEDVSLFDQRGCLSPRLLFVLGDSARATEVAQELSRRLEAFEQRVPRGRLSEHERAAITSYRDTARYTGELFAAGHGFVSVCTDERLLLPPIGRNVHVLPATSIPRALGHAARFVTSCAIEPTSAELVAELQHALPGARVCAFGQMQRPPFDGPVDRRTRLNDKLQVTAPVALL